MALTTSGAISASDIRAEFNNGVGINIGINSYYRADPYLPLTASGQISYADFYGADARTAEIGAQHSGDGYGIPGQSGRTGWSAIQGSGYVYGGETNTNFNAFGSISRLLNLSTGQPIQALYAQDQSWSNGTTNTNTIRSIVLTKRGAGNTSTTGGFTQVRFRYNNAINQYGLPGPSTVDYEEFIDRIAATGFVSLPGTFRNSEFAYAWYWTVTSSSNVNQYSRIYYAMRAGLTIPTATNWISIKIIY